MNALIKLDLSDNYIEELKTELPRISKVSSIVFIFNSVPKDLENMYELKLSDITCIDISDYHFYLATG